MENSKNDSKRREGPRPKKIATKQVESRFMSSTQASTSNSKLVLHSTQSDNPSNHTSLSSFGDISKIIPESSSQNAPSTQKVKHKKGKICKDQKEEQARLKEEYDVEYIKYIQGLYVYSELKHSMREEEKQLAKTMKEMDDDVEQEQRKLSELRERRIFLEEAKKVLEMKKYLSDYVKKASSEVDKVTDRSTELYDAVRKSQDKLNLNQVKPTSADLLQAALKDFKEKTKEARSLVDDVGGDVSEEAQLRQKLHHSYAKVNEGMERVIEKTKVIEALYMQKVGLETLKIDESAS